MSSTMNRQWNGYSGVTGGGMPVAYSPPPYNADSSKFRSSCRPGQHVSSNGRSWFARCLRRTHVRRTRERRPCHHALGACFHRRRYPEKDLGYASSGVHVCAQQKGSGCWRRWRRATSPTTSHARTRTATS
eukprot:21095_4